MFIFSILHWQYCSTAFSIVIALYTLFNFSRIFFHMGQIISSISHMGGEVEIFLLAADFCLIKNMQKWSAPTLNMKEGGQRGWVETLFSSGAETYFL